jgi:hypothetical protein
MTDPDLDRWTAEWQQGTPPTADLARMARRERRLLLAWIAVDWLFGAAGIAFAAWMWFVLATPMMRFAAIGVAVLIVAVLAFTIVNWRGTLAGERASSADFLSLAMARCRARLRYVLFGWWVLAADVVVIAGTFALEVRDEGTARLPVIIGLTVAVTAAVAGILWWWGGRERRRMERLVAMQQALAAEKESGHE